MERSGHLPSYAEAKKIKSLELNAREVANASYPWLPQGELKGLLLRNFLKVVNVKGVLTSQA